MSARRDAREQLALDSDAEIARCPHCGVTNDDAMKRIDGLRENIEGLERDLRTKRSAITRLQNEGGHQLTNSKHYPDALNVLEHWRDVCHPDAREIKGGERLKNVHDRLKGGYRPDQLMECADGYAVFAYVVDSRRRTSGPPSCRRIDAELIYRDPQHVDQGLAYAAEAQRRQQVIPGEQDPSEVLNLSELGLSAVKYARFGWHVFPIRARSKEPARANGFKNASIDVPGIARYWQMNPDDNVAIRCGVESGVVVLDVDGEDGTESLRKLEAEYEPLPETLTIVTPRGGSHFYFHHPGVEIRNTAGYPKPRLDIRGDGGYVLAPPSVSEEGRCYELEERVALADMPAWLVKLLLHRQSKVSTVFKDYAEIVKSGVREGERNSELLSLAGHLWGRIEPNEVLQLVDAVNRARCSPPLSVREVESIVASVGKMRAREGLRRTE